jgi:hypothetical protein
MRHIILSLQSSQQILDDLITGLVYYMVLMNDTMYCQQREEKMDGDVKLMNSDLSIVHTGAYYASVYQKQE